MERRLAVILAADVVEYTRLTAEDQDRTLSALRQLRRELLSPTVSKHRGRVIKSMGDGWLVEFPSVSDATTCAIAVQKELNHNEVIRLRIGIHAGEVVFEDEDVFGDGVNLAARLQECARPGGIIVSDTAQQSLDQKSSKHFASGDVVRLKNVPRPISIWYWPTDQNSQFQISPNFKEKSGIVSVCFEGLAYLDGQADYESLCSGINDSVRIALSSQPKVSVIDQEDKADIVVKGQIRFSGKRYRASTTLVMGDNGEILRADKYDGTIVDLFETEDELSRNIYTNIRFSIFRYEQERALRDDRPIDQLDNETLLTRAAPSFSDLQREGFLKAQEICNIILTRDPDNASALSLAALSHTIETPCGWRDASPEDARLALEFARKSAQKDPRSAFAHVTVSWVTLDLEYDYTAAILAAESALGITPNYTQALNALGNALTFSGEVKHGVELQIQALEAFKEQKLASGMTPYTAFGLVLEKRYSEALMLCRRAEQRVGPVANLMLPLILSAMHQGDNETVKWGCTRLLSRYPDYCLSKQRRWPLKNELVWQQQIDILQQAGLPI